MLRTVSRQAWHGVCREHSILSLNITAYKSISRYCTTKPNGETIHILRNRIYDLIVEPNLEFSKLKSSTEDEGKEDGQDTRKVEVTEQYTVSDHGKLIKHRPVIFKPHSKTTGLSELRPLVEYPRSQNKDSPSHLLYANYNKENSAIKLLNTEQLQWNKIETPTLSELVNLWLKLSKFRLTGLVVMTTMVGYTMSAVTFEPSILLATAVGTALTSASAAAMNQFLEVPFDSQMVRTRSRPLVLGQISSLHAVTFSAVTAAAGLGTLAVFVNPLTTTLGLINLVLYTSVYTPMKRSNILNTWVGSLVGAIPPVMGFTAASGCLTPGALLLGGILYSWQFPHFNALSWNLRHDYARAGYRMMSVTRPELCLQTAFRHSILLSSYCLLACTPYFGLTSLWFALDTLPFNVYLIYLAYKFKCDPSASSSRTLFRYSLVYLPAIIMCMIIAKSSLEGSSAVVGSEATVAERTKTISWR